MPGDVPPGAKVIRWYCCLGAGDAPDQVEVEKKVIDDFNAAHDDVQIAGEFVLYAQAYDTLATEIAGGNPPDIIGPVGFGGANAFAGHWLDLQPLIDSTGFDTTQCESSQVDYFKVGDTRKACRSRSIPSELYYQRGRVPGDRHQRAAAQVRRRLRRHVGPAAAHSTSPKARLSRGTTTRPA